jgi:hypothetical protein
MWPPRVARPFLPSGLYAHGKGRLTTRFDETNPISSTMIYADRLPVSAEFCGDRADG